MTTDVRHATDVVAYTYKAESLCPKCVVRWTVKTATVGAYIAEDRRRVEEWLDFLAKTQRVNRQDEHSFDSGDFPKVVFASQLEHDEQCTACGEQL